MNSRGQTLVLFVILLPLLLSLTVLVIDVGNNYLRLNQLNSINKMVVKYGLKNLEDSHLREKMIVLLNKNYPHLDNYFLIINEEEIILEINSKEKGVFGKIIGFDLYEINSHYRGYFQDGEIILEKGKI
ncbi:MAG: hypothetical protein ACOXZR_04545 [Bacilli bacterium]|jgi:hypothetical protein